MNDEILKNMETHSISNVEISFWKNLIDRYLFPVDKDEKREKKMHEDLVVLRNNVCMFFCLVNALFVIIIFTIEFSLSNSKATSFEMCPDSDKSTKDTNVITIVFMMVFGITLLVQFIAMFFHRYETFMHILSSVTIEPKMMSKMEINNFWSVLSTPDNDPSEVGSIASDLSETSVKDRRPPRLYRRNIGKKKKKHRCLEEKMDKKFSSNYDHLEKTTSNATKKVPLTSAQMSWMLLLQNPQIKMAASQYRNEIKKKWNYAVKSVIHQKLKQKMGTTILPTPLSPVSEGASLTNLYEDKLDSEGPITLNEDQLDSSKNNKNSKLVSVIVHSDKKDSLELDKQKIEAIDQQDSGSTHQRDPDMDQNGAECVSIQEIETDIAPTHLKDVPQGKLSEHHNEDLSGFTEDQSIQDNRSVSSEISTEVSTIQITISSDDDEDITRF